MLTHHTLIDKMTVRCLYQNGSGWAVALFRTLICVSSIVRQPPLISKSFMKEGNHEEKRNHQISW